MQFITKIALALAISSSALISTAIAVPTPQMLGIIGEQAGNTAVQSRQCIWEPRTGERGDEFSDCVLARQMLGASVDDGDVQSRQIAHASIPDVSGQ